LTAERLILATIKSVLIAYLIVAYIIRYSKNVQFIFTICTCHLIMANICSEISFSGTSTHIWGGFTNFRMKLHLLFDKILDLKGNLVTAPLTRELYSYGMFQCIQIGWWRTSTIQKCVSAYDTWVVQSSALTRPSDPKT